MNKACHNWREYSKCDSDDEDYAVGSTVSIIAAKTAPKQPAHKKISDERDKSHQDSGDSKEASVVIFDM